MINTINTVGMSYSTRNLSRNNATRKKIFGFVAGALCAISPAVAQNSQQKVYKLPSVRYESSKYHISYQDPKTMKMNSFKTRYPMVAELYTQMQKYMADGITPEEQFEMKKAMIEALPERAMNLQPYGGIVSSGFLALELYDQLVDLYTQDASPRGKTISYQEALEFMKIWQNKTSQYDEVH